MEWKQNIIQKVIVEVQVRDDIVLDQSGRERESEVWLEFRYI